MFCFAGCDIQNFRSLYFRLSNMRMSSIPVTIKNMTVDACAERCVRETKFECKSFDINNKWRDCRLFNHSHEDPFIHLIPSTYVDHYRSKCWLYCIIDPSCSRWCYNSCHQLLSQLSLWFQLTNGMTHCCYDMGFSVSLICDC